MKARQNLNWIQKMWFDCTTNPLTGEYSLSRLQPVWATIMATLLTIPYVIELHIYPEQSFSVKQPPLEVLYAWGLVALGLVYALIKDKSNARNLIEKVIEKAPAEETAPKPENEQEA